MEILIGMLYDSINNSFKSTATDNPLVYSSAIIVADARKNALKSGISTAIYTQLQSSQQFKLQDLILELVSFFTSSDFVESLKKKTISSDSGTLENQKEEKNFNNTQGPLRKINPKLKKLAEQYCIERGLSSKFDVDPEVNVVYCYGLTLKPTQSFKDFEPIQKHQLDSLSIKTTEEILLAHPILLQSKNFTRIIRIVFELYSTAEVYDVKPIFLIRSIVAALCKAQTTGISSGKKIAAVEAWIGELIANNILDYARPEVLSDKPGRYIGNVARAAAFLLGSKILHFASVKADPLVIFLKKINMESLVQYRSDKEMRKVVTFYDMFFLTLASGMPAANKSKLDDQMLEFQKDPKLKSSIYFNICETFGGWIIEPKSDSRKALFQLKETEVEYSKKIKAELITVMDGLRLAIKKRDTQLSKVITVLALRDQFCLDIILYIINSIN